MSPGNSFSSLLQWWKHISFKNAVLHRALTFPALILINPGQSVAWNGWTQSWLSIMGLLCWHAPLRTTTHIFLNKQAYCSSHKVIYGEKSAKRPGLTGGSQRGIILSWVERESHIFKSKDHLSSGSPNFYGPTSLPFLCGFRKEGSSILSQIEKGNWVTLKPIKPFLNISFLCFFSKHKNFWSNTNFSAFN